MKKLFLRLFLSIVAITVLSLAVQNGLLLAKYSQSQREWRQVTYDDFVVNLQSNLMNSSFPDFSVDSISLFSPALADSRVSGFLVRDQEGRIAFTVGQTTEGIVLSTLAPQNMMITEYGYLVSAKSNRTILNIRYNRGFVSIERTDFINEESDYYIPNGISANDVIGTVTVQFEGNTLSSIDILSYTPRTYKYSKDIINNCFHTLLVTIPVCLLIALVFAWVISSKNTKYIDSIRKALNDLSEGKHNIELKPNKNSSLNEITLAVKDLDENLQANEKSRQAWLTSISHDLNTPATAMKMIVDGMNDGIFKANKTILKDLQKENDILCERIKKVIDFSTLQADTKPVIEKIHSDEFKEAILNSFDDVAIKCDIDELVCDRILMMRAISELLKNAFANSDKVNLSISKAQKDYIIEVSNVGKLPEGSTPESLFEPWAKGDLSRSSSGNGLGLPIVGAIAKLHNGSASIIEKDNTVIASIIWPL